MKKLREWIYTILLYMNAIVLFSMFAILLIQVVYRSWLNDPLSWSEEIALLTMIWITFVGAYQCTAEDNHLKMSFLDNLLPKKFSVILNMFTKVLITLLLVITAYVGIPLLEASVSRLLPVSQISMLVPYLIIWGSIVLMLIETVAQIYDETKKIFGSQNTNSSDVTKGGSN